MTLPAPGDLFADKYEVVELIARGGFGRVFRALHRDMQREVAVKILAPADLEGDAARLGLVAMPGDELLARFRREARLISRLRSPATITLYDFGQTPDGVPWMVMEYIHGQTLAALLHSSGPLPPARVAALLEPVLESLREAHGLGIIHRDIKPQNIMVRQGWGGQDEVKVLDFGVAKVQGEWAATAHQTADGQALGTVRYIAPEILRGEPPTPACDVYALGLVAHELLTGRHPIGAARPTDVIREQISPRPFRLPPDLAIPEGLRRWIDRLTAKDPGARFPDAAAALDALHALQHELDLAAGIDAIDLTPRAPTPTDAATTRALLAEPDDAPTEHTPAHQAAAQVQRALDALADNEPTSAWRHSSPRDHSPEEEEELGATTMESAEYARRLVAQAQLLAIAEQPTGPTRATQPPPTATAPHAPTATPTGALPLGATPATPTSPPSPAPRGSKLPLALAIAVALFATVLTTVVIALMLDASANRSTPPPTTTPQAPTPDAEADETPPTPARVVIVRTEPPFATIEVNGQTVGSSPVALPVERLRFPAHVAATLDGRRQETTVEHPDIVEVVLDLSEQPTPPRSAATPASSATARPRRASTAPPRSAPTPRRAASAPTSTPAPKDGGIRPLD